ncbi:hypothetical protein Ancab_038016 [Ancistrocladus abbreviatus]
MQQERRNYAVPSKERPLAQMSIPQHGLKRGKPLNVTFQVRADCDIHLGKMFFMEGVYVSSISQGVTPVCH